MAEIRVDGDVYPFLATQASVPVYESIEFKTAIVTSDNGTESRVALRSIARRNVEYVLVEQENALQDTYNTLYGNLRKIWLVTLWAEGQKIPDVVAGTGSIACDTYSRFFQVGKPALLYVDSNNWAKIDILGVSASGITFTGLSQTFTNAVLYPLRQGWIDGNVKRDVTGHSGEIWVSFRIIDDVAPDAEVPEQFLGEDIYSEPSFLTGLNSSREIQQQVSYTDFEIGKIEFHSPWVSPRYVYDFKVQLQTALELRIFKAFLQRRMGRKRGFWLPSFENDISILIGLDNLIGSTLTVMANSLPSFASNRTHIGILQTSGVWLFRTITALGTITTDTVLVTLDNAVNIKPSSIARISFLGFYRLLADKTDLHWVGNNVCESAYGVVELLP